MMNETVTQSGRLNGWTGSIDADASRGFHWEPIIYFYCIYIGIIFAGAIAGIQTTYYGAAVFIVMLYARYGRRLLNLGMSLMVFCILLNIIFPLIPLISFDGDMLLKIWPDLVKYWALLFVMLIGMCLPLTPLPLARRAWMLYFVVLAFLVTGWAMSQGGGLHGERVKGFLPNPNVFALTAMMLPLLVKNESKGGLVRGANHLVVLTLIYVSHTSGAIVGYFAGMLHRFIFANREGSVVIRSMVMTIAVAAATIIFFAIPANTFRPVDRAIENIAVAGENIGRVFSGKSIEYSDIVERQGDDVTSGAWRLSHWRRLWVRFWDSSFDKVLFGYGIGSSAAIFQLKPHNDYLRLLLETGIVGFVFFMAVWVMIYLRTYERYRWAVIMVAVFCVTENNYDHFPAMSLLVLYMMGAAKSKGQGESTLATTDANETNENNLPE